MGFSMGFFPRFSDFFDKLTLFICYLFKLYKKHVKRVRDKTKMIFKKTKKIKIKYINVLKIE